MRNCIRRNFHVCGDQELMRCAIEQKKTLMQVICVHNSSWKHLKRNMNG